MGESDITLDELKRALWLTHKYSFQEVEKTFFDVGMRGHYENPLTELLAFFINPNNEHGLGNIFFDGFLEALAIDKKEVGGFENIFREYGTVNGGRLDLLIQTTQAVIAIECKVYHLQNNPFEVYQKDIEELFDKDLHKHYVVLSIDGSIAEYSTASEQWVGVSFSQLVQSIQNKIGSKLIAHPFNKWLVLARELLLHMNNYTEKGFSLTENDRFVIEHFDEFSKVVRARKELLDKLHERLKELKVLFETNSSYADLWIYAKQTLVFDFVILSSEKELKTAFDLVLSPEEGWRLYLFGRDAQSQVFLRDHQSEFIEENTRCVRYDGLDRYKLCCFKIDEELETIKKTVEHHLSKIKALQKTHAVSIRRSP